MSKTNLAKLIHIFFSRFEGMRGEKTKYFAPKYGGNNNGFRKWRNWTEKNNFWRKSNGRWGYSKSGTCFLGVASEKCGTVRPWDTRPWATRALQMHGFYLGARNFEIYRFMYIHSEFEASLSGGLHLPSSVGQESWIF